MNLNKYIWGLLISVSIFLSYYSTPGQDFAFMLGKAFGTFLWPVLIVFVVILIAKIFKKKPSLITKKSIFFFAMGVKHSLPNLSNFYKK